MNEVCFESRKQLESWQGCSNLFVIPLDLSHSFYISLYFFLDFSIFLVFRQFTDVMSVTCRKKIICICKFTVFFLAFWHFSCLIFYWNWTHFSQLNYHFLLNGVILRLYWELLLEICNRPGGVNVFKIR